MGRRAEAALGKFISAPRRASGSHLRSFFSRWAVAPKAACGKFISAGFATEQLREPKDEGLTPTNEGLTAHDSSA
jgi:hypothetical protein